jgi:hypothetical protein
MATRRPVRWQTIGRYPDLDEFDCPGKTGLAGRQSRSSNSAEPRAHTRANNRNTKPF